MLSQIPLLSSLIFAAVYPLHFWISARDPLREGFHHFHLGMPCVVAALVTVGLWFQDVALLIKILAVGWTVLLLLLTAFAWNKDFPNPFMVTVPCLIGVGVFVLLQAGWVGDAARFAVGGVLGGLILAASFYTMNLGHWYLNVHGLNIQHLMRAVNVFGLLLVLRLVWDTFFLTSSEVLHRGEMLPLWQFGMTIDGIFLWVGVLFGTLFPLGSIYLVRETLKVKSTQSATGILYVLLIGVLIGEITCKYYLLRLGVVL